ncbi:ABC transporter substrate-binding protein [Nostoc sp. 3335mG]|nr:ABC transporter substrate-binding protein [Nostoc sp. 3335mG]
MDRRHALGLIGGAVAAGFAPGAFAAPLDTVIKTGVMSFAVYRDFEPWAWRDKDGKLVGIDVDLADLLAQAIAVRAEVQELIPGDDVGADLRNAVWRGSVLGRPPADVLMHVPVDRQLALDNDRAVICAPYCRESFTMACNRDRVDDCEVAPDQFKGRPLAAEIDTVPDFYLTSTGGGVLRPNVKHFPSGVAAVAAAAGDGADVVVATRAQIEHGTVAAPDKLTQRKGALPGMFSPGWNVGIAVKDNSRDLGDRLDSVMAQLIANGKVAAIFERYGVVYRPPVDA